LGSCFGEDKLSPYTEEELAYTNLCTPASRAASNMFKKPVAFA
jgi:hypothetical protein